MTTPGKDTDMKFFKDYFIGKGTIEIFPINMEIPKKAGIKNFIIVSRKQKESTIKKGRAYFVNDLKLGLAILKP